VQAFVTPIPWCSLYGGPYLAEQAHRQLQAELRHAMCAISMPVGGHNLQEDQTQQWHAMSASEASSIPLGLDSQGVLANPSHPNMHQQQYLEAILQCTLLLSLLSLTSSYTQLL